MRGTITAWTAAFLFAFPARAENAQGGERSGLMGVSVTVTASARIDVRAHSVLVTQREGTYGIRLDAPAERSPGGPRLRHQLEHGVLRVSIDF